MAIEVRITSLEMRDLWGEARSEARMKFPRLFDDRTSLGDPEWEAFFHSVTVNYRDLTFALAKERGLDLSREFKYWKDDFSEAVVFVQRADDEKESIKRLASAFKRSSETEEITDNDPGRATGPPLPRGA